MPSGFLIRSRSRKGSWLLFSSSKVKFSLGWYELKESRICWSLSGFMIRNRSSTYFLIRRISLGKLGTIESRRSFRVRLEISGARLLPIARPEI